MNMEFTDEQVEEAIIDFDNFVIMGLFWFELQQYIEDKSK
jgi:hypothetical protein